MECVFAQVQTSFSYAVYIESIWGTMMPSSPEYILGKYDDIRIVDSKYTHPSNYYIRITINDFLLTNGSNYKNRVKNNQWYEYTGTIEYFTSDVGGNEIKNYTIDDRIKSSLGLCFGAPSAYETNLKGFRVIKKAAKIMIAPYQKYPILYNIFFDGYGIALDLRPPFGIDY